jgi:hypothetical protein
MKKRFFAFLLLVAVAGSVYLPGQVRAADNRVNSVITTAEISAAKDVRYVRVRGKRYKVWYKTFYKKGKRYVRITKIRRA